ncbi:MAG: hypothetical protein R3247_15380, partial [Rhodothermales bacterium]|nr:hypothetical protein [Rhodothermales bacterium]
MFSAETETGQRLERRRGSLAAAVVERCYARDPSMAERYGPAGRAKCEQDSTYHLAYLAEALIAGSATLFADYVRWAAAVLVSRSIPTSDLVLHLRALREVLSESLDAPGADAARA